LLVRSGGRVVTDRGLPPVVGRFIADHVTSIAQLEVLLLLRAHAGDAFSADEVGRELRIEPTWAEGELRELAAHGLLEERSERRWCFAPSTVDLADAVAAIADAYTHRRVSVITAICARPSSSIRIFANAFRLRKD
jgi:hypothetical protein